ncbi:Diaminohydroxyphosphoribosylamino-pyrimidine deaminase [Smittium mucronatum]|uniref:Diaminohydroxyphosphoribosylamino-pyrimidine deaminase n=1 Tax=Smittium mucronatum TaxID=133383 RepID=A0A1R0H6Q4_9FUNG|nr:Diaminohydroxyphosphoribosylamino-pyrimidine deaminase [Smittium mucronatum]
MGNKKALKVVYDHKESAEYENAYEFMNLAIQQAFMAPTVSTAFNVGSVVVVDDVVMSTGYSREHPGNTHAAEVALAKLNPQKLSHGSSLYNTMEPCSHRLSGKESCADRIIRAGVAKVYIGVKEPSTFSECKGCQTLLDAGIDVIYMQMLQERCLEPNRELLNRNFYKQ